MTAPRRRTLFVVGLLFVLFGTFFLAGQSSTVRNRVLRWAESELTQRLGREVRAASVELRPLQGRLELRHVRVANGPHPADGTLLAVDSIRADWSWRALLRRSLAFDRVLLVRPRLTLGATDSSAAPSAAWLSFLFDAGPLLPGWVAGKPGTG